MGLKSAMQNWVAFASALFPSVAIAAAGGVAEGFDSESWLARWPVVSIVVATVVITTALILSHRAKLIRKDPE